MQYIFHQPFKEVDSAKVKVSKELLGTIIGEETGGVTVNFGDVHIFELPNTGLKIMTSWEQAFSACRIDNQRGVMADFEVINSIEAYINKKDRVLDFTLNLINDNK